MSSGEDELLQQFKAYLKETFDKECVEAYLKKPTVSAITDKALATLKQAIDEAGQT
jgi:hypothetical protein